MKKYFLVLFVFLLLTGCSPEPKTEADPNIRYLDMIQLIRDYDSFKDKSNYFDISAEIARLEDGTYRYYVMIDNTRVAIYDLEAIAIEMDVDYTRKMAANIGIFEEKEYNLVPNQANPNKGFYQGIVASGTGTKGDTELYVVVQWKNRDLSIQHREFFCLPVSYNRGVTQ